MSRRDGGLAKPKAGQTKSRKRHGLSLLLALELALRTADGGRRMARMCLRLSFGEWRNGQEAGDRTSAPSSVV